MRKSDSAAALDPITVEVVRNKLEGIANEMQQTLLRSRSRRSSRKGSTHPRACSRSRARRLAQAMRDPDPSRHPDPLRREILEFFRIDR